MLRACFKLHAFVCLLQSVLDVNVQHSRVPTPKIGFLQKSLLGFQPVPPPRSSHKRCAGKCRNGGRMSQRREDGVAKDDAREERGDRGRSVGGACSSQAMSDANDELVAPETEGRGGGPGRGRTGVESQRGGVVGDDWGKSWEEGRW